MGVAKRIIEEHEASRETAIGIALEAGVLKECENHGEVFEGYEDIGEAYKFCDNKFPNDDNSKMKDIIKEVVEDHCASECQLCAKNFSED